MMQQPPQFNIVAQTSENTVVTRFVPAKRRAESFQSEAALEAEFIRMLGEQGYEYLGNPTEEALIANLRAQLESLNDVRFTEDEWQRFFTQCLANPNEGIAEKSRKIQEDWRQTLRRDDGSSKNIALIDKKNIHNNRLQVLNQYAVGQEQGARHANRYDVTVLVNGLPLVHVELKRRGVALREAFNQIGRYQRDSFAAGSGLFEWVQVFVISNGTHSKYYSNTTRAAAIDEVKKAGRSKRKTSNSFEFTSWWADAGNTPIMDLMDFARTFFARHTILSILTRWCVFTAEDMLLVMRPYQIVAAERILNRIDRSNNYKTWGSTEGGGFVWHTTGSGKTLTSFKAARLAQSLGYIDKVLFVVDRKDLDYQTMKEYDRFEKGAANSNASTAILRRQLEDVGCHLIITTIQKLSNFIKGNPGHAVYGQRVVLIFDECHRSQFGDMHAAIVRHFKRYHIFGFTGTPIMAKNSAAARNPRFPTTAQLFGECLHQYTIVDAINDHNVLPFRVDYIRTMEREPDIDDKKVWDIDRERVFMAPERVGLVTRYILQHFAQKTYRNKSYQVKTLANISAVAAAARGAVQEQRVQRHVSGFNAIFCVASVEMAKLYYAEFQRQMRENPQHALRVGLIYSYGANEGEADGIIDEENLEDTSALDTPSRDFLDAAIRDYNALFGTNYSTDGESFQNYYRDVSLRMKNRELDLLIVVNMFLTGFDATTLNTLWVDKSLRMHGLVQAFSRTNRILNSVKAFGNIVCFRNLQKRVDEAIALFGDKSAGGVVLLRTFREYFEGYTDEKGKRHPGYRELVAELLEKFPPDEPRIEGEGRQKEFIALFGALLRLRHLLLSFDDFAGNDILPERELQDYLSRYQDLRDEWRGRKQADKEDITDDVVFEVELVRQVEINIDYILELVQKYHDSQCRDKELLASISRAVNASPELRSKKELIDSFLASVNGMEDVRGGWQRHVAQECERQFRRLVEEERLNEAEARKFMDGAFRDGEVKTSGTELDRLLPPMSRFGGGGRQARKLAVIEKLQAFFERFYGLGALSFQQEQQQ